MTHGPAQLRSTPLKSRSSPGNSSDLSKNTEREAFSKADRMVVSCPQTWIKRFKHMKAHKDWERELENRRMETFGSVIQWGHVVSITYNTPLVFGRSKFVEC